MSRHSAGTEKIDGRLAAVVAGSLLILLAVPLQAGEANAPEPGAAADLVASGQFLEPSCVESDTVMCLHEGRYEATVEFTEPDGDMGFAMVARPRTRDSGLFYFFSYNNWEVLLKVLDACGSVFNNHWVYAASASDVGMKLVVRDTTLPEEIDGRRSIDSRTYTFKPVSRRAQMPGEPDDDYARDVLAKGHLALTESGAFPDACGS